MSGKFSKDDIGFLKDSINFVFFFFFLQRTLCGCDAPTEFKVATREHPHQDVFYVIEDSGFCCRLCCESIHPFKMTMSVGAEPGGAVVAVYERPLACHVGACKCCCFQEIFVNDGATGGQVGSVKESCWMCIPQFNVYDNARQMLYAIHMPTCCGCLPNCCAEGCCRVPFYVYNTSNTNKESPDGKIVKMWGSLGTELMGVHQFECDFPSNSPPDHKALLMGATYLLNELFFKPQHKDNGAPN